MREWLTKKREELKFSQGKLAELCGISQSYISAIETGERNVPVHTAKKIATVLCFDWTEFYNEKTPRKKRR